VKNGKSYPKVSKEEFEAWAGELLDKETYPEGDWAKWGDYVNSKKKA